MTVQDMDPLMLAATDETRMGEAISSAEHDKALSDLREVVRYLRQENSSLDLKCETLVQEKIMYPPNRRLTMNLLTS